MWLASQAYNLLFVVDHSNALEVQPLHSCEYIDLLKAVPRGF
jgi:hypothetical protein